ncbi:hypothetical protein R6Q59_034130 [Mikania micrantha]
MVKRSRSQWILQFYVGERHAPKMKDKNPNYYELRFSVSPLTTTATARNHHSRRRLIPATAADRCSEVLIEPDLKETQFRVYVEDCAAAVLDLGFPNRCRRHSRIRVPANPSRRVLLLQPLLLAIRVSGSPDW